jgi:serine/threonine protein kinase
MAPEVFLHKEYNETVDIYSYAMILYQLLVGLPPWAQLSGLDAVRRASEEGDRPLIPRDIDIRLQQLLQDCWDEKTSTRPPFAKVLDALSSYSKDVFRQDSREQFDVRESDRRGCCCLM